MKDEISMTKLQAPEGHRKPALDVRREEDDSPVLDYKLKIGIQELQNEIQVCL